MAIHAINRYGYARFVTVDGVGVYPVPYGVPIPRGSEIESQRIGRRIHLTVLGTGATLHPLYTAHTTIAKTKFTFKVVTDYQEKIRVEQLLAEQHYKGSASGVITGVYSQTDDLAACLVLSRLTYADPPRRREFFGGSATSGGRDQIAWIRRIATADAYRRIGLATILSERAGEIARMHISPAIRYVEVFTSRLAVDVSSNGEYYKDDFLRTAGFSPVGSPQRRRIEWSESGAEPRRLAGFSYYYIREL